MLRSLLFVFYFNLVQGDGIARGFEDRFDLIDGFRSTSSVLCNGHMSLNQGIGNQRQLLFNRFTATAAGVAATTAYPGVCACAARLIIGFHAVRRRPAGVFSHVGDCAVRAEIAAAVAWSTQFSGVTTRARALSTCHKRRGTFFDAGAALAHSI
jgi:hypothetical protein